MVQTGAKIQFGGLKLGLFNKAYQDEIEGVVTKDPAKATKKVRAKELISLETFTCFTLSLFRKKVNGLST